MKHERHAFDEMLQSDAGLRFARLQQVMGLVGQVAGNEPAGRETAFDQNARISSAYDRAAPVVQRRFDTLVAEASGWASAGVDALAAAKNPSKPPRAAAGLLAEEIEHAMQDIARLLRV